MTVWRRKTIELFGIKFEHRDFSIYELMYELIHRLPDLHNKNNTEKLSDIYGYVVWCYNQRAKDLGNSAGVSFYEHLPDNEITFEQIPFWVKPYIFEDVKGLINWRVKDTDKYRSLVDHYNEVNKTNINY